MTQMNDVLNALSEDDVKLITLARAARARIGAAQGAAIRDSTGRTYSSANVRIDKTELSASTLAIAQALASGAKGIEAVVVCCDAPLEAFDVNVIANVARGALFIRIPLTGDVSQSHVI